MGTKVSGKSLGPDLHRVELQPDLLRQQRFVEPGHVVPQHHMAAFIDLELSRVLRQLRLVLGPVFAAVLCQHRDLPAADNRAIVRESLGSEEAARRWWWDGDGDGETGVRKFSPKLAATGSGPPQSGRTRSCHRS